MTIFFNLKDYRNYLSLVYDLHLDSEISCKCVDCEEYKSIIDRERHKEKLSEEISGRE